MSTDSGSLGVDLGLWMIVIPEHANSDMLFIYCLLHSTITVKPTNARTSRNCPFRR